MLEIDLRDPALAAILAWLIPGAGHLSNLERSDQFTRALCDFLLARL